MDWYPPKWNIANIPPHLLMPGPPPEAPPSSGPEPHDVFYRLKWSILDPPSDAQVFVRNDSGTFQWLPLSDESNKSLLDEAATQPPQSRLQISLEPLNSWWHWHDSGTDHLRPAPLVIENADGQPVSVSQFMHTVHGYAVPLRRLLLRCMDVWGSVEQERARFWFHMIMRGIKGEEAGQRELAVYAVEDLKGDGEECASIWEGLETRVGKESATQ